MTPRQIEALKQQLLSAEEFGAVMRTFLGYTADDPEFFAAGEPIRSPFLQPILDTIATQIFGAGARAADVALFRFAEHGFVHGALTFAGRPANVLFFEDPGVGLTACVMGFVPPETRFVRFRAQGLSPPSTEPSTGPRNGPGTGGRHCL